MSCLYCFKNLSPLNNIKSVSFSDKVTVIYFEQTPNETNVCWMQVARDRMRFKRRMLNTEQQIGWVFAKSHRDRMYRILYL